MKKLLVILAFVGSLGLTFNAFGWALVVCNNSQVSVIVHACTMNVNGQCYTYGRFLVKTPAKSASPNRAVAGLCMGNAYFSIVSNGKFLDSTFLGNASNQCSNAIVRVSPALKVTIERKDGNVSAASDCKITN